MKENVLLPLGNSFEFWEEDCEYTNTLYVDASAKEKGDGSARKPYKTIQEAADAAAPATRVVIRGGVYRECVHPRRGGTDARHMISYEAAAGEKPVIKASEIVTDFTESRGWQKTMRFQEESDIKIWELKLKPELFEGYNPFNAINLIHDRLFIEYAKTDMTPYLNRRGMIFCDGRPLHQVALSNMLTGDDWDYYAEENEHDLSRTEGVYWVESNGQTVHFRLPNDENPSEHLIEVSVREQCFAPEEPFLSYIKVSGLTCAHAATGAPVPQRGAISALRGHHWVIEKCKIDWSNTVGIDIGDECWHHTRDDKRLIGYSVVRGCKILNSGVCGIAGLFATHLLIEDNLIAGTGWQKMELSWEAGAVKLHNTVDTLFRRNIFRNTIRADHLWLDCGNENTRITQNLFLDGIQQREAVFIECTRDEINLIDHNIFWNVEGRFCESDVPKESGSSGWYSMTEKDIINGYAIYGEGTDHLRIVGNFIGKCRSAGYFSKPVSFRMHGLERGGTSRDARIAGNIFYACEEAAIKFPTKDNQADANVYVKETGGYLRVMYPAPPSNLHLPAWQEFFGFDMNGSEAWFDADINTKDYSIELKRSESRLPAPKQMLGKRLFAYTPNDLKPADISVYTDATGLSEKVIRSQDFFGNAIDGDKIAAGPFNKLEEGVKYSIDPRKVK